MFTRSIVLVLLAVTAPAIARADPAPIDPADVVGAWRGTARWIGCAVSGPAHVAVAITVHDGAYVVALGQVRDDLGEVAVADTRGALIGQRDDLSVRFVPGARATATIASSGGCTARLALTRASTGLAACDRWAALAAVEASCPAATVSAERSARLAAGAPTWARLTGGRRRAAAATCATEVDDLRASLTEAGCLGAPAGESGTGVPACDAYLDVVARYLRCPNVSPAARQAIGRGARVLVDSLRSLRDPGTPAEARARADHDCAVEAAQRVVEARAARCPL